MQFARCIFDKSFALLHYVFIVLQEFAARSSMKLIFWKPTLSNRPSKIHFLEHWRPYVNTFGAYRSLTSFVRLCSASVAHYNLGSRSRYVQFWALKPDPQNDNTYHTCNFVAFWWLVPFAVCFWWLHTHFFCKNVVAACNVFVFLQKYAPRSSRKHIFET